MKWIKDFVYDHNDLVVALLIIAVAASVIYGRMNLILDYPATVAAASEEAGQSVVDPNAGQTNPGGDTPTPGGDTPTPGGDTPTPGGDTPGGDDNPGGDTPNPGGDTPTPGGDTPTPTEYEYVNFHIAYGEYSGWEPLAKGLQTAGIIEDARSLYLRVIDRVNMGDQRDYNFYTGTYSLPKGADNDTLIDIIRDVSNVTPDD